MRLKFIRRDRGSFSGGLLLFLPVCCRDRAERVLRGTHNATLW
ncbi:plasmid mobilization protein [Salmonella enterica subsp. enterica serovar Typhimurium]|nr:plasmid mobilization protein [Salmonella enterica]ECS2263677.1 plasmid mobilization protein [Salmonella enterica subsp. enterica serovar Typhimurium]EGX6081412.1 plasmid mobilization protein [Salmonella enterica]